MVQLPQPDDPISTPRGTNLLSGKTVVLDTAKPYLIAALCEELGLPVMVTTAQFEGLHVYANNTNMATIAAM